MLKLLLLMSPPVNAYKYFLVQLKVLKIIKHNHILFHINSSIVVTWKLKILNLKVATNYCNQ